MRPKDEPVKTPTVVSSDDRKGPAQVSMPEPRPQALLVENTRPVPVAVSEPMPEFNPMVPLPPDIDPSQVAIVRHDVKKDGERFKYVDKTLKPLNGSDRRPEVIKYSDKHGVDVIKYQATSAAPKPKSEATSKPAGEVLKYKPVRVEIN